MSDDRSPHGISLRKGRVSEIGLAYLVTFVTRDRRPLFEDLWRGRRVVAELRAAHVVGLADTLAFVVMPDHCHWLMMLRDRTLSSVVGRVKARSAQTLGLGAIWQPGFHDHALRDEEDIRDIARYIVANPVRAGLVPRLADYSLWDASWM